MYGFVENIDKAALYFRPIVEMEGFGTNYESVNSCGAMFESSDLIPKDYRIQVFELWITPVDFQ
ncbi:hypothetical protein N7493_002920 [Penicillium malachiteum]|uniref:Uncharacterized protein n=1 Tax=Penicillium malachiteum TaxID=1324776 RepID=A0AAD6HSU5_9EURO|nr:hypothetical protein N7493_002920 [Penicillium malachiteum]